MLNSAGVPAKRGGRWHAMSVRSVLSTAPQGGDGSKLRQQHERRDAGPLLRLPSSAQRHGASSESPMA